MTILTDAHWAILNTRGGAALADARNAGELPDCPEVNARIAQRYFWENPVNYNFGLWFFARYTNSKYRNGRVSVRKVVFPDDSIRYTVVAPNGRWCDSLTEEEAKKHLVAFRNEGQLVYLNEKEIEQAEDDHNWALSR